MKTDAIEAIGIDDRGSLWVRPATSTFPFMYREAMEVQWDAERSSLYSPAPRDWSYVDWFARIKAAAREQEVDLVLVAATRWHGVDPELQKAFTSASGH